MEGGGRKGRREERREGGKEEERERDGGEETALKIKIKQFTKSGGSQQLELNEQRRLN